MSELLKCDCCGAPLENSGRCSYCGNVYLVESPAMQGSRLRDLTAQSIQCDKAELAKLKKELLLAQLQAFQPQLQLVPFAYPGYYGQCSVSAYMTGQFIW